MIPETSTIHYANVSPVGEGCGDEPLSLSLTVTPDLARRLAGYAKFIKGHNDIHKIETFKGGLHVDWFQDSLPPKSESDADKPREYAESMSCVTLNIRDDSLVITGYIHKSDQEMVSDSIPLSEIPGCDAGSAPASLAETLSSWLKSGDDLPVLDVTQRLIQSGVLVKGDLSGEARQVLEEYEAEQSPRFR